MLEGFEKANNLNLFISPENGIRYRYMNPEEVKELANEFSNQLSPYKDRELIWLDSGAAPLVNLIDYPNSRGIKAPRETDDFLVYISFLLSADEKDDVLSSSVLKDIHNLTGIKLALGTTRETALREFADELRLNPPNDLQEAIESYYEMRTIPIVKVFNTLLEDTQFSRLLRKPIVLIDEYVCSGTILRNANLLLALFNNSFEYKLFTYSFRGSNIELPSYLAYTTYRKSFAELNPAYPFENRIDDIGYFYTVVDQELVKTIIESQEVIDFSVLESWRENINERDLINDMNKNLSSEQQQLNSNAHMILYGLYKTDSDPIRSSLWEQLFEMIAPCWAPLPDEVHQSFTKAYELHFKGMPVLPTNAYPQLYQSMMSYLSKIKVEKEGAYINA